MKGTISEMEIASFRERAHAALLQKAERGALVQRVPIGYVKGADDRIEKDPDIRIASTVDLIFRKFAELGSVRQVFFWLDQQHIPLPVARGPEASREIVWQPARYHAVLSVLKNPVYAGTYAYGRTKTTVRLEDGQKRVSRRKQRRREDWAVLITDHHEGYIDWDAYQSNQTMIAHNDNARSAAVRGSVRQGGALLAGLLRCGHCGAKLLAQYPSPRVIRYQCSGYLLNRDHACCVMFGGLRADRLVSAQLLQCLAPFGSEAAIEAIESLQGGSDERIRQKGLALEQARYGVTRARRQYDAVDPANRLVVAELERRWNQALAEEAQIEVELTNLQQGRERPLTDAQKRELLAFARDLPGRMCCNFEKAARDRLVESTGIILGSHFEQPVDELNLPPNIRTAHPPHLPLPNHVHRLISLNRSPRRKEFTKALLGLHSSFDRSMILLQDVVQVLDRPMSAAAA
jgi:hypothetical protein